jgi:hypothetical protein
MIVSIGLEILMPYTIYKGALFRNEEYERVKDELDKKEQEYLNLLLGEKLEPKEVPEEDYSSDTSVAFEDSVDSQEAQPSVESGETTDSGESEARQARRKRQK